MAPRHGPLKALVHRGAAVCARLHPFLRLRLHLHLHPHPHVRLRLRVHPHLHLHLHLHLGAGNSTKTPAMSGDPPKISFQGP